MSSLQGSSIISTIPAADLVPLKDINNGKASTAACDGGRKGDQIETIKKLFRNAELSASAYDTAWVAMVRSPAAAAASKAPIFPGCLEWVLENQHKDGSWGDSQQQQPGLVKDALSSTLACVLALKSWGVGEQHVHAALEFLERHSGSLTDSSQYTPVGFDLIFPAMVQTGSLDFDLNLPLRAADKDLMMQRRELELNSPLRNKGRAAYLAYIAEGLGEDSPHLWETAMKFKRKNGSLFDSPSATAAAYLRRQDADSLGYLRAMVDGIADPDTIAAVAVPALYPHEIQAQLCLIDAVDSLGVERHFRREMKAALDKIYVWWQQQEEEEEDAVLDIKTCAMAFRILRRNGYPVAPGVLGRFSTEDSFRDDTLEGYLNDEEVVMELLKASEIRYSNESILEDQHVWTSRYLFRSHGGSQLSGAPQSSAENRSTPRNPIATQLRDLFDFPFYVDLNRLSTRRKIEQYRTDNSRISKSSFICPNYGSEDLLKLAVEDFNLCQSFHQQELKQVMSWLEEYKLDGKRSAKLKMGYSYFSAAANLFEPRLSRARISFAKQSHLTGLVDEFYDEFGTQEEQLNLLDLLERWDVSGPQAKFCSEEVETLYWALHSAICETVDNAFAYQGRSVMDHVVQLWVDALRSMVKESDWARTKTVPTFDEYMRNATTSFALGPSAVTTLYLLGPPLLDEAARGPEIRNLYRVMSVTGRLLNDCVGFEREAQEGKLNAVSLLMLRDNRTAEDVVREIRRGIDDQTRELFRLVLDESSTSGVSKESRNLFWMMTKLVHLVYQKDDGYNSTNLARVAESVIKEPISLNPNAPSLLLMN